ncbi:unnamed protein product [Spirodela intermedia]|uniref:Uncharacterized protein n=1 Tax=Spirodela intermedia TaxID=51605 RepID=A0A7I8IP86_SPIIN|nr:unnamed protein product [Spirodela intermedia]CAA6659776.1 unnamed protein product [Spirodela intermedia]
MVIIWIFAAGAGALFFLIIFITRWPSGIKKDARKSSNGDDEMAPSTAAISRYRSSSLRDLIGFEAPPLPMTVENSEDLNVHLIKRLASVKYTPRAASSFVGDSAHGGRTSEELDEELQMSRESGRRDSQDDDEELERELITRFFFLKNCDTAIDDGGIVKPVAVEKEEVCCKSEKGDQREVNSSNEADAPAGDQFPPENDAGGVDSDRPDCDSIGDGSYDSLFDSEELEEYLERQFPDSEEIIRNPTIKSAMAEQKQIWEEEARDSEDLSVVASIEDPLRDEELDP